MKADIFVVSLPKADRMETTVGTGPSGTTSMRLWAFQMGRVSVSALWRKGGPEVLLLLVWPMGSLWARPKLLLSKGS